MAAILGVKSGEREIEHVVMMGWKTYLIHIKQSLCPYMGILTSPTSFLFHPLEEFCTVLKKKQC